MQKLKPLFRAIARHWFVMSSLIVVLAVGVTLGASPESRHSVHQAWHRVLAWAGLTAEDSEDAQAYWCPMHPQIKSNKANALCPLCNMALVKIDESHEGLTLMPQQIQQAGVVTKVVKRRRLYRAIDTTGRLDYDERRRIGISSWVAGKSRIEKLHVNFEGQRVRKGQLMAEIYSPELITAQEEFLVALKYAERREPRNKRGRSNAPSFNVDLVESARRKLLDQGMKPDQIDELAKSRQAREFVPIPAPVSGTVIEKHIQEGQYVQEGKWLFHLADLSRLWLFVDVFEEELHSVKQGTPVELTVQAFPDETFVGTTAFVDRRVDPSTRTVRVRIDVDNDDRGLLPGMYARATIREAVPPTLAVPDNAVLWSGKRTVVIVKNGAGTFEPREVQLGKQWLYEASESRKGRDSAVSSIGERRQRFHEVLYGLSPGEDVVTAGAFLLNAESQFRNVLAKMLPPEDERASLAEVVGKPIARRMQELLKAYFELSGILADDRIEDVTDALDSLKRATAALREAAGEEQADQLRKDAHQFEQLMAELTSAPLKDAKDARTRFGRISYNLTKLLIANGGKTLFGKSLYQFECGMANVGYERWLWRNPQIHNPYMGRRMPKCGTRLEVFEP